MEIDAHLFTDNAVADETRAFNEQLAGLLAGLPPVASMEPQQVRDLRESGRGPFGPVVVSDLAEDRSIPGPAGEIPIRVFIAEEVRGVYLHLHGGGWTLGGAHLQDPFNEAMAREASVVVVSVGYRLAPEHPYPAPNDDCEAAAVWLVEHAAAEFGTDRFVVGGESAGAHLAAATLLRLRDRHGYTGWRGANLVYGAYDLAGTPSTRREGLVLTRDAIAWFNGHYLGGSGADLRDPDVSPLWADLSGMPPALFSVGTWDPLLDDTLFMTARWTAAGNEAELALYPGGIHAFDAFPIAIAAAARDRMHRFVASRVA